MRKIILLAVVCYFLIAPFTFHPDTKLTLRYASIGNGSVWDIYGYINSHKLDIPDFHYPPAHFWWLKIQYPISKFIAGKGFDKWLDSGSSQASFNVNALRYNLASKFPLLLLGIICGWLIYKIVLRETENKNKAKLAAMFWYFNPVTIYSLVAMGQNDIVAIFLTLLAIWYYREWVIAVVCFGLAAGVKSYPIIWAIIFWLAVEKNFVKLLIKTTLTLAVYGLILLPWMFKPYFISAVLNSGLSQRMLIANIPIGFDKQILIIPLLLLLIGLNAWNNRKKDKIIGANLAIFESSLVILGFSHFNPQWMLWLIPFLSVWWPSSGAKKKDILVMFIIMMTWVGLTLSFDDRFLTWGILTPISPNLINFPSLFEFIKNKGGSLSSEVNLCQTVLAGVSIWYLTSRLRMKEKITIRYNCRNYWVFLPWGLALVSIFLLANFTVDVASYSQTENKEVSLQEIADQNWVYKTGMNLRYFEVSLDNPGLNSQDSAILVVNDGKGNTFTKELSGFNAGADSWVRVDVPVNMSDSKALTMSVENVIIHDGLLKIRLDSQNRWAVNLYNRQKPGYGEIGSKLEAFWWWWLVMAGMTFYYLRVDTD